jgi:hypothetical protein
VTGSFPGGLDNDDQFGPLTSQYLGRFQEEQGLLDYGFVKRGVLDPFTFKNLGETVFRASDAVDREDTSTFYYVHNNNRGDGFYQRHPDVPEAKRLLNLLYGATLYMDEELGPVTSRFLTQFQDDFGLLQYGFIQRGLLDPVTLSKLNAAVAAHWDAAWLTQNVDYQTNRRPELSERVKKGLEAFPTNFVGVSITVTSCKLGSEPEFELCIAAYRAGQEYHGQRYPPLDELFPLYREGERGLRARQAFATMAANEQTAHTLTAMLGGLSFLRVENVQVAKSSLRLPQGLSEKQCELLRPVEVGASWFSDRRHCP